MLEMYSFVDYFTIPPSFLSIYLGRTWIGKYMYNDKMIKKTIIKKILFYYYIYFRGRIILFIITILTFRIYINLFGFSRSKVPPSSAPNDSAWYFAIFKHSKNVEFNSTCSTRVYFYIRVVDRRRNHSSRKYYLFKLHNLIHLYFLFFWLS